MPRKPAKKKTTLECEALALALWILKAMIYVRTVSSYFLREKSRLKPVIAEYVVATANSISENHILAVLAIRTGRHDSCGGNIHLAVVGVGPMFDFYNMESIRHVDYKEKSKILIQDFLWDIDEVCPYYGNIHVHPVHHYNGITIGNILQQLQADHGPENGSFQANCSVYLLELVLGKPVAWQRCTNADLARVCAASLKLAVFLFVH